MLTLELSAAPLSRFCRPWPRRVARLPSREDCWGVPNGASGERWVRPDPPDEPNQHIQAPMTETGTTSILRDCRCSTCGEPALSAPTEDWDPDGISLSAIVCRNCEATFD